MTPNTEPKGKKTDRGVYSPSLPAPSQRTLPAPVLSAPHSSVSGATPSPKAQALALEPSTGVLSVPRSFISRWMLSPVLKGKLQIALRTSLSFP